MVKFSPILSTLYHVLLEHFCMGLDEESALYLDVFAGGSFAHETPSEGRKILDRMSDSSFIAEPSPEKSVRQTIRII